MVFFDANRGMSSRGLLQWVEVVEAQYLQNGQDDISIKNHSTVMVSLEWRFKLQ